MNSKARLVPPDGGWGWVVCLAFAFASVVTVPLISHLGLVFQEVFPMLGIPSVEGSSVIHLHQAIGMAYSIYNRRVLASFGYRKSAIIGTVATSMGLLLASTTQTTFYFILTYSLFTSVGICMITTSFAMALNSYFQKRRTKASDVVLLCTGLGSVATPFLIASLMPFGSRHTMIVLASICLNSVVAACLLRPVKWYMKPEKATKSSTNGTVKISLRQRTLADMIESSDSEDYMSESEEDYLELGTKRKLHILTQSAENLDREIRSGQPRTRSFDDLGNSKAVIVAPKPYKWWRSKSAEVNLDSSFDIFKIKEIYYNSMSTVDNIEDEDAKPVFKYSTTRRAIASAEEDQVASVHKSDSLTDFKLVNVIFGVCVSHVAEISFSVLTPFILRDVSSDCMDIAKVLAVISGADFFYRFTSPLIGEWCHKSARAMFYMSLYMLFFTRTIFMLANSFESLMVAAFGLGIAKGIHSVYIFEVIPSHIDKDNISKVTAIQAAVSAILLTILGPVMGHIRDKHSSYKIPVVLINAITLATIVVWSLEFIYAKLKSRKCDQSQKSPT